MVSCPAWLYCVSYRQETFCEQFPVRRDATVFLTDRKLFAYSFLSGVMPQCFLPIGNYLRMVSYPAWFHCVSYQQETFCEQFPVRHSFTVFHSNRKLFANGFLSGVMPQCFLPIGNFSTGDFSTSLEMTERLGSIVFHLNRKLFAYGFLSGVALLCFLPTGNFLRIVSCPA